MTIEIPTWLSDELAEEFLERCEQEGLIIGPPTQAEGSTPGSRLYTIGAKGVSPNDLEARKEAKAKAERIIAELRKRLDKEIEWELESYRKG